MGEAFGFKVDYSHSTDTSYPTYSKLDTDVPNNAVLLRNLAMGSNYLMSHILHFYHLVALDYVDVNGTGLIPKGFLCPNYDSSYYARGIDPILQTGGLGVPAYTVNNAPGANPGIPAAHLGDLTPYFAGQYVRALKARRQAHQLGALFAGKMPHASAYTAGCMTTKAYDPSVTGPDGQVAIKVRELLYAGPGYTGASRVHPYNNQTITVSNPHPESLLGFIGKPLDFWMWASGYDSVTQAPGVYAAFDPSVLPYWAKAGVGAAGPNWQPYTGTFCFDTVAAAHVFPEYFWFGAGYGRYLAWGIFEGANPSMPDKRLITRGRVHIPRNNNGSGQSYAFAQRPASHLDAKEFTTNSWYTDSSLNKGRHMWKGKTSPVTESLKPSAYTFAKTPRLFNDNDVAPVKSSGTWAPTGEGALHPDDKYLPYEVGPLARMINNAAYLATPGGPATLGEAVAVQTGQFSCYYPGIANHVDTIVAPALGLNTVGVMPGWGANLTHHVVTTLGVNVNNGALITGAFPQPAFYLPNNAVPGVVVTNGFAYDYGACATLDRIAARTFETYYVAVQMWNWFSALTPPAAGTGARKPADPDYDPTYPYDANWPNYTKNFTWGGSTVQTAPKKGKGAGLTEAPRGALGHWIVVGYKKNWSKKKKKKWRGLTQNYQIITPTAWNISPKDANDGVEGTTGAYGPIEKCVMNTPLVNEAEPIEIIRVIHSFDCCCACTVHLTNPKGEKVAEATLEATL